MFIFWNYLADNKKITQDIWEEIEEGRDKIYMRDMKRTAVRNHMTLHLFSSSVRLSLLYTPLL